MLLFLRNLILIVIYLHIYIYMRKTVACGESVIDTLVENIIDIGAYLKRKLFITLKTVYQKK